MPRTLSNKSGFSIIELLVVIVVVGILSGLGYVGYNSVRNMATDAVAKHNLQTAAQAIQMAIVLDDIPGSDQILSGAETSSEPEYTEGVKKTLAEVRLPDEAVVQLVSKRENTQQVAEQPSKQYNNLTPVQNGMLFYDVCNKLISGGAGKAKNKAGQMETYITACNVYNAPELEINGWNGRTLKVPVNAGDLNKVAESIRYNDSWRPDRDQAEKDFWTTWNKQFIELGGSYPVKSFWDPWANKWSGVAKEALPDIATKTETAQPTATYRFCLEISNKSTPDRFFHLTKLDGEIQKGRCS